MNYSDKKLLVLCLMSVLLRYFYSTCVVFNREFANGFVTLEVIIKPFFIHWVIKVHK